MFICTYCTFILNYNVNNFNSNQVASIFNCNESTVRRWTDRGILSCEKTAGGHRQFTMHDLRNFIIKSKFKKKIINFDLSSKTFEKIHSSVENLNFFELSKILAKQYASSDTLSASKTINYIYMSGIEIADIFDSVVEPSNDIIEELVKSEKISNTEEYISRKSITRSIEKFCDNKPNSKDNIKNALCVNFEDNIPDLGVVMSEVILREKGYNVYNTGSQAKLGNLKDFIETKNIDLAVFYLCNRQCCNSVTVKNLRKTISQIDNIISFFNSINLKVLFGGEGLKLIDTKKISSNNTFYTFKDFNSLL
ncbi:MAG: hypothetical protein CBD58_05065 [bacterium TMED198]|nr:MAG: hypothetical protein CBD58_05065 [bacterium TMED198]